MLRLKTAFLFALLLSASQTMAETQEVKALERDHDARGWEAVGRLDLGDGFCTGTLISSTLVLTAAHCLYDEDGRARPIDKITFNAGLRQSVAYAQRRISRAVAHKGYDPEKPLDAKQVAHDVALLELGSPISSAHIDPFLALRDRVSPGPVSVVAYRRDRTETQSRQKVCEYEGRYNNVLMFDCDVTFGSSGAPVFTHRNGRGRIISLISGGSKPGQDFKSFGPDLSRLLEPLKLELAQTPKRVIHGEATTVSDVTVREIRGARRIQVGQRSSTSAKFVRARQ